MPETLEEQLGVTQKPDYLGGLIAMMSTIGAGGAGWIGLRRLLKAREARQVAEQTMSKYRGLKASARRAYELEDDLGIAEHSALGDRMNQEDSLSSQLHHLAGSHLQGGRRAADDATAWVNGAIKALLLGGGIAGGGAALSALYPRVEQEPEPDLTIESSTRLPLEAPAPGDWYRRPQRMVRP